MLILIQNKCAHIPGMGAHLRYDTDMLFNRTFFQLPPSGINISGGGNHQKNVSNSNYEIVHLGGTVKRTIHFFIFRNKI